MVRDAVPLGECGRALVVKLGHHGDVLLASPVLSVLKAHAPQLEVDALVYDDTAPMLEGHPALAELHTIGRKWRSLGVAKKISLELQLLHRLRLRGYSLLVVLSEQRRGAWLARLLGTRYGVAPAMRERRAFWSGSFTHLYPMLNGNRRHQVEINLDALRRIGIQPALTERTVRFTPGAGAEARAQALVGGKRFVHIHPASRWRFKCWPAPKWAALIDRLSGQGMEVVLTAAPDEKPMVKEIVSATQAPVVDLAGELSLKELGAVIGHARLFVGVDSMPMHLAGAMGVPSVALFGPSGENEWGPWGVPHRVVTSSHPCRPCGLDGCGGGKVSECLTLLPVDAVYDAARALLGQTAAR